MAEVPNSASEKVDAHGVASAGMAARRLGMVGAAAVTVHGAAVTVCVAVVVSPASMLTRVGLYPLNSAITKMTADAMIAAHRQACDADWVTDRVAAGIQHTGDEVVGVEVGPQPLCQVEIQAGEMPARLRPHCRARRGVVVQHPPAVPVVAAFRQYEPTAKQRKVSRG
jgi:hypothetical protein